MLLAISTSAASAQTSPGATATVDLVEKEVMAGIRELRRGGLGSLTLAGELEILREGSLIFIPVLRGDSGDLTDLRPADMPDASGSAQGLSDDGATVVGYLDSGFFTPFHAFYWTEATGAIDLGTLLDDTFSSFATDVSADGSVVTGYSDAATSVLGVTTFHPFLWTEAGGMADLGTPFGMDGFGRAFGISADGSVVVGDADFATGDLFVPSLRHAFRWTEAGGFQDLGSLEPGFRSVAYDVTADGSQIAGMSGLELVIGGTSTNATHAFRWTEAEGMVDLGTLPGYTHSAATAISDNGAVIVGTSSQNPLSDNSPGGTLVFDETASRGFRWTAATGIADLNVLLTDAGIDLTGITIVAATDVTPDGLFIAGAAVTPDDDPGETTAVIICYADDATPGQSCEQDGVTTPESQNDSLEAIADARNAPGFHLGGLADTLLGANQPVGGGSEVGGFGSVGSLSFGTLGRFVAENGISVFGGLAYTQQEYDNVDIEHAVIGAAGVRYVWPEGMAMRPLLEAGGFVTPDLDLEFTRHYLNGAATATGIGETAGVASGIYARAGVVLTPAPASEIVLSGSLGGSWLHTDAYAEAASPANPFPATFGDATTSSLIAKISGQVSGDITERIEYGLSAALGQSFAASDDFDVVLAGVGPATGTIGDFAFVEYGARLGWQATERLSLGGFAQGTTGEDVGTHVQVGLDFRLSL